MPRSSTSRRPDGHRPYHHGDLRRALLDAALAILREQGPEALSLRGVARAAGVSQTAPYRHFADRAALVAGVAEDGFHRLRAHVVRAAAAPPPPGSTGRAGLQQIALAYVGFALEHPAEYRIMFGDELANLAPGALPPSYVESRVAVLGLVREGIARLQAHGLVRAGDAAAMALTCWALLHGLVMLMLDGQVSRATSSTPEDLATTATDLLMFGMTNDKTK